MVVAPVVARLAAEVHSILLGLHSPVACLYRENNEELITECSTNILALGAYFEFITFITTCVPLRKMLPICH